MVRAATSLARKPPLRGRVKERCRGCPGVRRFLLIARLRPGALKSDPAKAIITAIAGVTMASRVRRSDLWDMAEPAQRT